MIDARLTRHVLRVLRRRRFGNSRDAAHAAKLGPSTVAKIENQKKYPNYDPGIGIILKLLAACGISVVEFVTELQEIDQLGVEEYLRSQRFGRKDRASQLAQGGSHGRSLSPSDVATLDTLRRLVADLSGALSSAQMQLIEAGESAPGFSAPAAGGDHRATGTSK